MKRNYIAILICILAVFCMAAAPYRASDVNGDERPIFGCWKSNLDTAAADSASTNFLVFNFMKKQMQVIYCKGDSVTHNGTIDASYTDTKVFFADRDSKYSINGDTLHIRLGRVDYVAWRINSDDLPDNIASCIEVYEEDDSPKQIIRRTDTDVNLVKKGLAWILSWFD